MGGLWVREIVDSPCTTTQGFWTEYLMFIFLRSGKNSNMCEVQQTDVSLLVSWEE